MSKSLPCKHWCRMWWDILDTPVLVCGSRVPKLFWTGLSRRDLKLPTCALGKCPEPGQIRLHSRNQLMSSGANQSQLFFVKSHIFSSISSLVGSRYRFFCFLLMPFLLIIIVTTIVCCSTFAACWWLDKMITKGGAHPELLWDWGGPLLMVGMEIWCKEPPIRAPA